MTKINGDLLHKTLMYDMVCLTMNRKHEDIPVFHDETEERAFWETHDSTGHLDWSQARQAVFPDLKPTSRTISLRLPQHLLDAIKVATNARDVPYQSLIKTWLHEKLHGN